MHIHLLAALVALLAAPVRADIERHLFQHIMAGQASDSSAPAPAPGANRAPKWECTLGGWVRAPDLSPNTRVPAEARLVANGTGCGDIVGWGVGVRFLERGVFKRKNETATFPGTPTGQPGETLGQGVFYTRDMDDVFDDVYDGFDDGDYGGIGSMPPSMSQFRRQLKNRGLWEVHGAERKVFDTTHALPLEADMWLDEQWFEGVHSFVVNVPNTNFPPLTAPRIGPRFSPSGPFDVRGTTAVQDLCEYYIVVTRSNGEVVEVPAGKAGFIPAAEPTSAVGTPAAEWPMTYKFISPRTKEGPMYGSPVPDCDADSLAEFSIAVDYRSPEPIVQGKNVTLHATLTRSGNGSEVPHAMYFAHATAENYTWARGLVASDEEYDELETAAKGTSVPPWMGRHTLQSMLMAAPQDEIDRENERLRDWNGGGPIGGGPWGKHTVKHVFDPDTDLTAERIEFDIELPISYDDMVTFNRTFHSLTSTLAMSLQTRFACAPERKHDALPEPTSAAEAAVRARNNAWQEHEPAPIKSRHEFSDFIQWSQYQHGQIPLNVASPLIAGPLKHYMDPAALAPVITVGDEAVEYPPLGTELRPETESERVRARYKRRACREICPDLGGRGSICRPATCGGENKHAAKVWAYDQARRDGLDVWERDETFSQEVYWR